MRVLVLGGGYAGFTLCRSLEDHLSSEVELLCITDSPYHLLRHELHRVIRFPELADVLRIPLEDQFERTETIISTVDAVDEDDRIVTAGDEEIPYDLCAVCLGSTVEQPSTDGPERFSSTLTSIEDAREIRSQFDAITTDRTGVIRIVGGGLTGIQIAGELAALADGLDHPPEISLVERDETIAPMFPQPFREAIVRRLKAKGVSVETDSTVIRTDFSSVTLDDGRSLEHDQLIWAGGIRGVDAIGRRRPTVDCTLRSSSRTFFLGDAARVIDREGTSVKPSAQAAVGQAVVAAENIRRLIDFETDDRRVFEPHFKRYVFDPTAWVVSVGDDLVASVGSMVFEGQRAGDLKRLIDIRYLANTASASEALRYLKHSSLS